MTDNTVKKIETPPAQNSKELTFDKHDKFQRKEFAVRLTKVIKAFSPLYDEAFVLSLNAPFGRGKTTFLKMWQSLLESDDYGMECIYINAWEHDFDNSPIMPILASILEHLKKHQSKNAEDLKEATLGGLSIAATIGNDVLAHLTGADLKRAAEENKQKRAKLIQKAGETVYQEYILKQKAIEDLRVSLGQYVTTLESQPLVIFVDELDRARPSYSVEFLETIKHIFSIPGICFVLAVNKGQLRTSIKQLYGNIKFEEYYSRFITREANLPKVEDSLTIPFINFLFEKFRLNSEKCKVKLLFSIDPHGLFHQIMANTSITFGFTPRQIEKFFNMAVQFLSIETQEKKVTDEYLFTTLILMALKLHNEDVYQKLGNGDLSPKEVHQFFKDSLIFTYYKPEMLMSLLISRDEGENKDILRAMDGEGITLPENSHMLEDKLRARFGNHVSYNMSSYESKFEEVYKHIEDWKEFL